jgi:hypothetical protein
VRPHGVMADKASEKRAATGNEIDVAESRVDAVRAEHVKMHQSAAREVTADNVELQDCAALSIRGSIVDAHQSAVGAVRSNEVTLDQSLAAAIRADSVELNGYAGFVAAREVRGQQIRALIIRGNKIEGEVRPVFNSRQAVVAGLVGGLFAGLILSLTRVLFRRD